MDVESIRKELMNVLEENRMLREKLDIYSSRLRFIETQLNQVKKDGRIDPLTKTFNRSAFDKDVETMHGICCGLMLIDIDDFKKINDTYGHSAGDRALKLVSKVLLKNIRGNSKIYRVGGEEFAIIIPFDTTKDRKIKKVADRIVESVRSEEYNIGADDLENKKIINITVSIGCSVKRDRRELFEHLFDRCDRALYQAKASGKDKVVYVE